MKVCEAQLQQQRSSLLVYVSVDYKCKAQEWRWIPLICELLAELVSRWLFLFSLSPFRCVSFPPAQLVQDFSLFKGPVMLHTVKREEYYVVGDCIYLYTALPQVYVTCICMFGTNHILSNTLSILSCNQMLWYLLTRTLLWLYVYDYMSLYRINWRLSYSENLMIGKGSCSSEAAGNNLFFIYRPILESCWLWPCTPDDRQR